MSANNLELDFDKGNDKKMSKNVNPMHASAILIPTKKNPIKIFPESPKTIEACHELGVDPDYFKIKGVESFGGTHVPEKFQKMRHNHYLNRVTRKFFENS